MDQVYFIPTIAHSNIHFIFSAFDCYEHHINITLFRIRLVIWFSSRGSQAELWLMFEDEQCIMYQISDYFFTQFFVICPISTLLILYVLYFPVIISILYGINCMCIVLDLFDMYSWRDIAYMFSRSRVASTYGLGRWWVSILH